MGSYRYSRHVSRFRWFALGVVTTVAVIGFVSAVNAEKVTEAVEWIADKASEGVDKMSSNETTSDTTKPKPDFTVRDAPISVSDIWAWDLGLLGGMLKVELKPTEYLQLDTPYNVYLWYDNYIEARKRLIWKRGEVVQVVTFDISSDSSSYVQLAKGKAAKDIFSVTITGLLDLSPDAPAKIPPPPAR